MRSRFASSTSAMLGTACALLAAGSAVAQTAGYATGLLNDRFVVNGGVFLMNSDVRANLNGSSSTNGEVNFDDSFGKSSDATRGRVDALWRINPKHHLRLMYFNYSNTRSKAIDRDIQWGDLTYKLGGNVEAQTKLSATSLAYEYAFMREPTYEIAGAAGVHYTDMSLRLSGNATINSGGTTVSGVQTKSSSLPAPLPVIGLRGGWVVAPDWHLNAQAMFFRINADGYDGHWTDLQLGATWMFSRHMGVGLGYNQFITRVDVNRSDFNGRLKLGYSGLQAYLTGSF